MTPRIEEAATLPSSPAPPQNTKEEAEFLEADDSAKGLPYKLSVTAARQALQAEMPSRTVQAARSFAQL